MRATMEFGTGSSGRPGGRGRSHGPTISERPGWLDEALPFSTLRNAHGDEVHVHHLGATVTSYVKNRTNVIAMRPDSPADGAQAIRGGIPVRFPLLGDPDGIEFGRVANWTASVVEPGDEPSVQLTLRDSLHTRSLWDHAFEATLTVRLKEASLLLELRVRNTDTETSAFMFQSGLHSYWAISSLEDTNVRFGESSFVNMAEHYLHTSDRSTLFGNSSGDVLLEDRSRRLKIQQTGWHDFLLFNSYKSDGSGYETYIAVESIDSKNITLQPQMDWVGTMEVWPEGL